MRRVQHRRVGWLMEAQGRGASPAGRALERPRARLVAAIVGGLQAMIAIVFGGTFLYFAAVDARSHDSFAELGAAIALFAGLGLLLVGLALGTLALLSPRSAIAAAALGAWELAVLSLSLLARGQPGWAGGVWSPLSVAAAVLVLVCLVASWPALIGRPAAGVVVAAAAICLIMYGQPPIPTFGWVPPGVPGSLVFADRMGCVFAVNPTPRAAVTAYPCTQPAAREERYRLSAQGFGEIVETCQHVTVVAGDGSTSFRSRSPQHACLDLGGSAPPITASGPSDYSFESGRWSPDHRWVAFTDTRRRLLIAKADGTGPWRVSGDAAVVIGWAPTTDPSSAWRPLPPASAGGACRIAVSTPDCAPTPGNPADGAGSSVANPPRSATDRCSTAPRPSSSAATSSCRGVNAG